MKRSEHVFLTIVAVFAGFVGHEVLAAHRTAHHPARRATAPAASRAVTESRGVESRGVRDGDPGDTAGVTRDDDEVQRRLRDAGPSTYIGEVLLARDSSVARWPDRRTRPLRIWIQTPALAGWQPDFAARVRGAFDEWASTGIPLSFSYVRDSASADVHVTWTDHFNEEISGKTLWARDDHWWIVEANIILALRHSTGEPLDASSVRAIALHEVGHLIGLDHTADASNVMTPRVRVRDLSPADRATAQLLYTLPPGPLPSGTLR